MLKTPCCLAALLLASALPCAAQVPDAPGRSTPPAEEIANPPPVAVDPTPDVIIDPQGDVLIERDRVESAPPPGIQVDSPAAIGVTSDDVPPTYAPRDIAPATPVAGVSPRPALGVQFERGGTVNVLRVIPGSPADRAGLHAGDRIIRINNAVVASTDAFITQVAALPLDASVEIVFVRGIDRHTVAMSPAAWGAVYDASSSSHTVLRPDLEEGAEDVDPTAVYRHGRLPAHPYPLHYSTNVSPVLVPASWYATYPYYYGTWAWPGWYYNVYAPAYYPYYGSYPYYYGYYGYYPWGYAYPAWSVVPAYPAPGHVPGRKHDADSDTTDRSAPAVGTPVVAAKAPAP